MLPDYFMMPTSLIHSLRVVKAQRTCSTRGEFIDSMQPYDIMLVDKNDDTWSPNPTKPWQTCLGNGDLLDLLLVTTH